MIEWVIEGKEDFRMYSYGYTNDLLEKLEVLEGTLDIEKFQEGDYILIGRFHGSETLEASDGLYHPGDYVKVAGIADGATLQEIKKVYEVMAVVDIPYSMDMHRYTANAMDVVLPLRAFTESKENSVCFALSYKVEKEKQEAFEAMLKDYTENTNKFMGYASKNSLKQKFAVLQSIGMTGNQLVRMLILEGVRYVAAWHRLQKKSIVERLRENE